MKVLFRRMIGAARLDAETYEQVEADKTSFAGAVFVVVAASLAAAFGSGLRSAADVVGATLAAIATWLLWVGLTYIIGTHILPGEATHANLGEVFRTTGFSASPGILRILGLIPWLGVPIFIAVTFWMLLTFIVAIRQALDYATSGRALAVCLLGWLIHGFVFVVFVRTAI